MYTVITDERGVQGSAPWLSLRKNSVTATDLSKIMGVNPWSTAYHLWQEKLGLVELQKANEKMRLGSLLEEEARDYFNKLRKDTFKPVVLQNSSAEWQIASLDGMNDLGEILEIKCGAKSHEEALQGIIAPYYYTQLQWQMHVSCKSKVYYLSYRSKDDNKFWLVEKDDVFIEKMLVQAKEFYKNLIEFTPPILSDKDFVDRDDKEWRLHAEIYKEIKNKLKEFELKEVEIKLKLIELSDNKACKGYGVKVSKTSRAGNIDYSKIKELENVDLELYRKKTSEFWTIRSD